MGNDGGKNPMGLNNWKKKRGSEGSREVLVGGVLIPIFSGGLVSWKPTVLDNRAMLDFVT